MNIPEIEVRSPLFVVTDARGEGVAPYTVTLAIADQPVKSSRRALCCISAVVSRGGRALADAEVSLDFRPLQSRTAATVQPGALWLTHDHHPQMRPEQLCGSIALDDGSYRVDLIVNNEARAGFVLEM